MFKYSLFEFLNCAEFCPTGLGYAWVCLNISEVAKMDFIKKNKPSGGSISRAFPIDSRGHKIPPRAHLPN